MTAEVQKCSKNRSKNHHDVNLQWHRSPPSTSSDSGAAETAHDCLDFTDNSDTGWPVHVLPFPRSVRYPSKLGFHFGRGVISMAAKMETVLSFS
jgi:hypothetical protein